MGVVVAGLRVMAGSAVARVTPASSRGCPGPPEDGSEDEPLGDRQGAQADPHSDGTEEEGLHCGSQGADQHDAEQHGVLHLV